MKTHQPMLTLAEVKNNVAVSKGYPSWEEMENWYIDNNFLSNIAVLLSTAWNEVAKKYATAACEEQRKLDAQLVSEKMKGAKGMCMAIDILLTPLPTLK